jgi:hypothetical protein
MSTVSNNTLPLNAALYESYYRFPFVNLKFWRLYGVYPGGADREYYRLFLVSSSVLM